MNLKKFKAWVGVIDLDSPDKLEEAWAKANLFTDREKTLAQSIIFNKTASPQRELQKQKENEREEINGRF